MEDKEEVRVGTFIWEVDNFMDADCDEEDCCVSPNFKLGKHDCYLNIIGNTDMNDEHYYKIMLNDSNRKIINDLTSYKLSLIDGCGKECMVKMRRQRNGLKLYSDSVSLMKIWQFDLCCEENDLLPDGALTIHLSWCNKEESNCEREKEPSKLLPTLSENLGHSDVFAAMFCHDTSENRSGVVDIPDVNVSILNDVLYYVYSGRTRGMSAVTIIPMYIMADKYALIELRDTCLDFLMCNLTVEIVCDAAQLAHTHGETKLQEQVVQFVKENIEEIEETDKWKELLKSKSSLPVKLLRSALTIYKDEVKKLSSK